MAYLLTYFILHELYCIFVSDWDKNRRAFIDKWRKSGNNREERKKFLTDIMESDDKMSKNILFSMWCKLFLYGIWALAFNIYLLSTPFWREGIILFLFSIVLPTLFQKLLPYYYNDINAVSSYFILACYVWLLFIV